MKLLRIKLPDSLHARLKVQAAIASMSMQVVGAQAFESWVLNQEKYRESLRMQGTVNPQPQPQKQEAR